MRGNLPHSLSDHVFWGFRQGCGHVAGCGGQGGQGLERLLRGEFHFLHNQVEGLTQGMEGKLGLVGSQWCKLLIACKKLFFNLVVVCKHVYHSFRPFLFQVAGNRAIKRIALQNRGSMHSAAWI